MESILENVKTNPAIAIGLIVLILILSKVLKFGRKVLVLLVIAGLAYLMYTFYNGYAI